jgi:hypothetical protein
MPKIFVPAINNTEWETQLYHPIPIFKNTGWLKLAAVCRERFQMQSEKAWQTASMASRPMDGAVVSAERRPQMALWEHRKGT